MIYGLVDAAYTVLDVSSKHPSLFSVKLTPCFSVLLLAHLTAQQRCLAVFGFSVWTEEAYVVWHHFTC